MLHVLYNDKKWEIDYMIKNQYQWKRCKLKYSRLESNLIHLLAYSILSIICRNVIKTKILIVLNQNIEIDINDIEMKEEWQLKCFKTQSNAKILRMNSEQLRKALQWNWMVWSMRGHAISWSLCKHNLTVDSIILLFRLTFLEIW